MLCMLHHGTASLALVMFHIIEEELRSLSNRLLTLEDDSEELALRTGGP